MRWSTGKARRIGVSAATALLCMLSGGAVAIAASLSESEGAGWRNELTSSRRTPEIASLRQCFHAPVSAGCGEMHRYLREMKPCLQRARSQRCRAAIAFAHAPQNLIGGRVVRLDAILAKLSGVSHRLVGGHPHLYQTLLRAMTRPAARAVAAPIAAAFPVLEKAQTSGEARQLEAAISEAGARSVFHKGLVASGANVKLARRDWSAPNGDAGFLMPGSNGKVCSIHVYRRRVAGASCTTVDRRVREAGCIGMMVVSGGYEVYGELPAGTRGVRVTSAGEHAHEVDVNRWGGFDFIGSGVMSKLEVEMKDGRWQQRELGPFPPPPLPLSGLRPRYSAKPSSSR